MVNQSSQPVTNPAEGEQTSSSLAPAELERMRAYIGAVEWTFAKTMPTVPHWYTLRRKAPDLNGDFAWFAAGIRERGYRMRWGKYHHHYLNIDGWRYWTMGAPIEETILINREEIVHAEGG